MRRCAGVVGPLGLYCLSHEFKSSIPKATVQSARGLRMN